MNPAVRIIAMSGLAADGSAARAEAAGITHLLAKPYTAGCLLNMLQVVLKES